MCAFSANDLKKEIFKYLSNFGDDIGTKFSNICGKTGQYDVPTELFQKRTSRKNRVLISWKTVKNNKLTMDELKTFYGGVVVEFVNNDFFDETNSNLPLFNALKLRLGSDDDVSSMISIRSEEGTSSSQIQRNAFDKLIANTKVTYKGNDLIINKYNYQDFAIKRKEGLNETGIGTGNNKWDGFLFISIRGGQQDTIETHKGKEEKLFNPACEYANEKVCRDLDIVTSYFAMHSIDYNSLNDKSKVNYDNLLKLIQEYLKQREYDNESYNGNLLEYCDNHPCLKLDKNKLVDPIQLENIDIFDFGVKDKENPKNLDFTHDEAVNYNKFYWDKKQNCILSPARPTNIFWSKHLSNMMQQNFSLKEYFEHEKERVQRREKAMGNTN